LSSFAENVFRLRHQAAKPDAQACYLTS